MRIAELSRRSGVPVPTIKYYLRENLLAPGERSSPNQAAYGEEHLRRLHLIRALTDLARLPVARVREIVAGLDSGTLHEQIGRAHRAITPARTLDTDATTRAVAARQVEALLTAHGWSVRPDAPALTTLVDTLATLHTLGQDRLATLLDTYADAVDTFTEAEIAAVTTPDGPADQIAERVVLGTLLGETLLTSLRLIAQESVSAHRWQNRD